MRDTLKGDWLLMDMTILPNMQEALQQSYVELVPHNPPKSWTPPVLEIPPWHKAVLL
eukprot:gene18682-22758_t